MGHDIPDIPALALTLTLPRTCPSTRRQRPLLYPLPMTPMLWVLVRYVPQQARPY
jgi:hypothetical protein